LSLSLLAVFPPVAVKELLMSSHQSNSPETTKKTKILDFSAFKNKQDVNDEFSRARKPLYVNSKDGIISGSAEGAKDAAANEDFGDRLQKIRSSLDRINNLMADLKKLSSNKDKDHLI
jgi:predicted transcriptional regulator